MIEWKAAIIMRHNFDRKFAIFASTPLLSLLLVSCAPLQKQADFAVVNCPSGEEQAALGYASGMSELSEQDSKSETAQAQMVLKSLNSEDQYLPEQVDFINELIRFNETVTVLSEVEDGPLFDPESQEIWMPGSFADVVESYFDGQDAPVAEVYLHTLVHEVGHVLFSQYDLPLLAREEDAADALASVLLLEYLENGAEVVLKAAEMFGRESEDQEIFEEIDFWSEHSLDIQRYYTTLCHVYGSDPETHAELVNDEYGLSNERAETCEPEYQRIREGWLKILDPYLKR